MGDTAIGADEEPGLVLSLFEEALGEAVSLDASSSDAG